MRVIGYVGIVTLFTSLWVDVASAMPLAVNSDLNHIAINQEPPSASMSDVVAESDVKNTQSNEVPMTDGAELIVSKNN